MKDFFASDELAQVYLSSPSFYLETGHRSYPYSFDQLFQSEKQNKNFSKIISEVRFLATQTYLALNAVSTGAQATTRISSGRELFSI